MKPILKVTRRMCAARKPCDGETQDGWTAWVHAFSRARRSERLAILRHPQSDQLPRLRGRVPGRTWRAESRRWIFVPR